MLSTAARCGALQLAVETPSIFVILDLQQARQLGSENSCNRSLYKRIAHRVVEQASWRTFTGVAPGLYSRYFVNQQLVACPANLC